MLWVLVDGYSSWPGAWGQACFGPQKQSYLRAQEPPGWGDVLPRACPSPLPHGKSEACGSPAASVAVTSSGGASACCCFGLGVPLLRVSW